MNKETVENRIKDLEAELKKNQENLSQLQANIVAIHGAIQDNQFWLQEIEKKEKEKENEKVA